MLEGRYTDACLKEAGADAPKFTDDDLKVIGSPLDFVGINVYLPKYNVLATGDAPGWRTVALAKAHPKMGMSGAPMTPEAMYWAPRFVQSLWGAKEIFITENAAPPTTRWPTTARSTTPTESRSCAPT
jgi:beta-glucosidase